MARLVRAVALGLAAILGTGCATVLTGRNENLLVTSTPPGAQVTVNGIAFGRTPLVASVKRDEAHVVELDLDGYRRSVTLVRQRASWNVLWNFAAWGVYGAYLAFPAGTSDASVWRSAAAVTILGGAIGTGVDFLSGAAYRTEPDLVEATLTELPRPAASLPSAGPPPAGP